MVDEPGDLLAVMSSQAEVKPTISVNMMANVLFRAGPDAAFLDEPVDQTARDVAAEGPEAIEHGVEGAESR